METLFIKLCKQFSECLQQSTCHNLHLVRDSSVLLSPEDKFHEKTFGFSCVVELKRKIFVLINLTNKTLELRG